MGNSPKGNQNSEDWEVISSEIDYFLVQNKLTKKRAFKYSNIEVEGVNLDSIRPMLQVRTKNYQHVLGILGWEAVNYRYCSQSQIFNVYSQKVELRLSNLSNVPQNRGLQIMLDAIDGFIDIYRQTKKTTDITDSMICFDEDQNVKVWLNPNLGNMYPMARGHLQQSGNVEHDIINQVYLVVEQHIVNKRFSDNFIDYLSDKIPETFNRDIFHKSVQGYLDLQHSQPQPRKLTLTPLPPPQPRVSFEPPRQSFTPIQTMPVYSKPPPIIYQPIRQATVIPKPPQVIYSQKKLSTPVPVAFPSASVSPSAIPFGKKIEEPAMKQIAGHEYTVRNSFNVPPQFQEHFQDYMKKMGINL